MAAQRSAVAWRLPRTEEPGGCRPWGCNVATTGATERSEMTEVLSSQEAAS